MTLDDLTLTITICDTCRTILIATKNKRMHFTEEEVAFIDRIAELSGKTIRWERRSIKDHAHVHLE